ncbi:MAG: DUF4416 family protein [Calditrichaeota bacterium]|nr:DUF4416 family protein [Calditrichota bacterium]
MGTIKAHPPVKLICAITVSNVELWSAVQQQLEDVFSEMDCMGEWYDFTHTRYYEPEMGSGLKKRMVAFRQLILAEVLPDIKWTTNVIEDRFRQEGHRRVNLDPGYIATAKLVLATTKDYDHRVYLGRGIFGDLHLRFRQKHFHPLEWTYPDYREPFVIEFFERVREQYLTQLALFYEERLER